MAFNEGSFKRKRDVKVSIALLDEDMSRYFRYAGKIYRKVYWQWLIAAVAAVAANRYLMPLAETDEAYKNLPSPVQGLSSFFILFIVFNCVNYYLSRCSPVQKSHPDGAWRCPKEITIDKEGIHSKDKNNMYFSRWEGVLKIEADNDAIMLWNDLMGGYYIPKRFFNSAEEADAFFSQAQGYWGAAHRET